MIRSEEIHFKMLHNDVEYGELRAWNNAPTLRMNADGEIKISLQGTFLPTAIDSHGNDVEVDWLVDEIKPVLIIDGVSKPLGVLMPASVEPMKENNVETLSIEAYDRCWRCRDTKAERTLYFAKDREYIAVITNLLAACGIANIRKVPTQATLTESREDWETGTSYLTIINQFLREINYKELWFDSSGFAVLEPASVPSAVNVQHVFTNKKIDPRNRKEVNSISVYPTITKKTDIYQAPNVFLCVCSNPDKDGEMTAKAENKNPLSPLSVLRRRRRIVSVVKVDNIASQEDLQAYTDRLLNESMITGEIIEIKTPLQQDFGVEDVCAIQYDDLYGICVQKAWDMKLQPGGVMTHTLERVVVNIG